MPLTLKHKAQVLGLAFAIHLPVHAYQVIGIADGDTLTLLVDRQPVKIRLANIDAPELKQSFGQRSKQSLSDLCWGKDAQFEKQSVDRYGRIIAVVICGDLNANVGQVERGLAWVYPKYNKDPQLPSLQEGAKDDGRGLWYELNPVPPWEYRKMKSQKQ